MGLGGIRGHRLPAGCPAPLCLPLGPTYHVYFSTSSLDEVAARVPHRVPLPQPSLAPPAAKPPLPHPHGTPGWWDSPRGRGAQSPHPHVPRDLLSQREGGGARPPQSLSSLSMGLNQMPDFRVPPSLPTQRAGRWRPFSSQR